MSYEQLGLTFDIHGGASDLIFPHHENELAQSEAAFEVPFVRYWLHGGLLQVNAEKMSKSLGNFMLLRDVLTAYDAPVVRLFMLQTHYRSPLEFSTDRLDEARTAYERLANLVKNVRWARAASNRGTGAPDEARRSLVDSTLSARTKFEQEMDDDFNTAGALAAVFELAKAANTFLAEHQADLSTRGPRCARGGRIGRDRAAGRSRYRAARDTTLGISTGRRVACRPTRQLFGVESRRGGQRPSGSAFRRAQREELGGGGRRARRSHDSRLHDRGYGARCASRLRAERLRRCRHSSKGGMPFSRRCVRECPSSGYTLRVA